MSELRVVFAGTPAFAATALAAIHAAGFGLPLVLTQPDRPAGRAGFRQLPDLAEDQVTRDAAKPVHEQARLQVIHFVLQRPGQQAGAPQDAVRHPLG